MILKMAEKIDCALMGIDKCKVRQVILLAMDCIVCILSFAITMYLLDFKITTFSLLPMFIYAGINVGFLLYFRCYDSLWKCGGEKEVSNIFLACFCAAVTSLLVIAGLDYNMEVVFYVVNLLMVIVGMTSIRVTYRAMRRVVMQMKINQNFHAKFFGSFSKF